MRKKTGKNKKGDDRKDNERIKSIKLSDDTSQREREKSILDELDKKLEKKEAIVHLFDIENVKFKANITEEQRNIIASLMAAYNYAKLLGVSISEMLKQVYDFDAKININIEAFQFIIKEYVEYSPSLEGKRAEQYVDAHKAQIQNLMPPQMGMQGGQYGNYSPQMTAMKR